MLRPKSHFSVTSQVNCKWVLTSGQQYAAWLHVSTNRRLPGLTATKQVHMLTQPEPEALRWNSTAQDERDGLHMATNHSLQKAKEWNREEILYDSAKKQVACYWDPSQ